MFNRTLQVKMVKPSKTEATSTSADAIKKSLINETLTKDLKVTVAMIVGSFVVSRLVTVAAEIVIASIESK